MSLVSDIDPVAAKQAITDYCLRKGALVAGVADVDAVERIAPAGHRPSDLMPRVKSVIAVGVGGATQGAWRVPAKALSYFGSTESRAYKIVYGLAFFIEQKFGVQAIYCPPDMDPELGARYPLQSLKLHAELAGLGARSLAGDILLHPATATCITRHALPSSCCRLTSRSLRIRAPRPAALACSVGKAERHALSSSRPHASRERSTRRASRRQCATTWPLARSSPTI
jgi:hypothetical protein